MTLQKILESVDTILEYCLQATLILYAAAFLFGFSLNWEDWFFGTKIEGLPAGISLGAKGFAALALVLLVFLYPRYIRGFALVSIVYLGLLFIDSAFTIRRLTTASPLYNVQIVFLLIPVAFIIVRTRVTRMHKRRE